MGRMDSAYRAVDLSSGITSGASFLGAHLIQPEPGPGRQDGDFADPVNHGWESAWIDLGGEG